MDKSLQLDVINAQLEFFKKNKTGCAFAAYTAKNPEIYGWFFKVVSANPEIIDDEIRNAILAEDTTTLSLIFPDVNDINSFLTLIDILGDMEYIYLGQDVVYEGYRCLGYRVRVGNLISWVTGFGNFDFLPPTRRSPYTELTFRVKPRPNYKWVMKKAPDGVIHLADMYLRGTAETIFKKMWASSLVRTVQLTGHKLDLRSGAKTTYAVPKELLVGEFCQELAVEA